MFTETAKDIGRLYRGINRSISRDILPEGISGQQYRILRYIGTYSQTRNVYLCELETKLAICRSTASGLITELEEKGLVRREALEDDGRFKRLLLTAEGCRVIEQVVSGIAGLNLSLVKDITPEEMATFHQVAAKLSSNLEFASR